MAEHAGVSVRTVSNVVNNYVYVSAEMRERVQASLAELQYKMDYVARGLRSGRTGMVALVVPHLEEPYFAELAQAVIRSAASRGLIVLIESVGNDEELETSIMRGALSTVADGVLLSATAATMQDAPDVPLVLLGEHTPTYHGDHVGIDNVSAARVVTRHLIAQGSRRIAPLGVGGTATAGLRYQGFREELQASGIRPVQRLVIPAAGWSPQSGYDAVCRFLRKQRGPRPDAIFAFNDSLAFGALRALREHGIAVPGEVAVAGIDNLQQSAFVDPPLTSLAPNLEALADVALTALVDQIEGKKGRGDYRRKVTPFELRVRASTDRPSDAVAGRPPTAARLSDRSRDWTAS